MSRGSNFIRWTIVAIATAGCAEKSTGPDPFAPVFYDLIRVNDRALPLNLGGQAMMLGGKLVPYAVGHPGDQRLINDRTGRGATGGNTRDTTVLRGQMMDLRRLRIKVYLDSVDVNDSTVVDVEIRDTVFIVKYPHIDPARVSADTGVIIGNTLILPTRIRGTYFGSGSSTSATFKYQITR
jgi:hypothetical protein